MSAIDARRGSHESYVLRGPVCQKALQNKDSATLDGEQTLRPPESACRVLVYKCEYNCTRITVVAFAYER